MFTIKPISKEAQPAALERAERYRLLNEPIEAESICLDVLNVDPESQEALVILLLSLTDQFEERLAEAFEKARHLLPRLQDEYRRVYYDGVICERRAKAHLRHGGPDSGRVADAWLRQAMERFEKAERIRPPENDEAILRWNTCARILMSHPDLTPPRETQNLEQMLE